MYRMTGDKRYITDGKAGWEKVMRHHGQASGVFTGDETLSGLPPARGTETCTVVEIMNSAGEMFLTTGDVWYADRLEQIAYNALPAVSPPLVCASGGLLFGRLAELGKSMCSKFGLSSNAMVPITSELLRAPPAKRLYARRLWKGRSIFSRATENGPAFCAIFRVRKQVHSEIPALLARLAWCAVRRSAPGFHERYDVEPELLPASQQAGRDRWLRVRLHILLRHGLRVLRQQPRPR